MLAGRAAGPVDFRLVVAPLALILIAYPAIVVVSPGFRGPLLVGVSTLLAALIFIRLFDIAWPTIWLLLLAVIYALSSWFGPNRDRGFVHTLALVCVATVFLTFAIYGSAILSDKWVRFVVGVIISIDIAVISLGHLPKNAAGGALIYVIAVACVVALQRPDANGWRVAALFFVSGIIIALTLEVRSLFVYSSLFLVAFICASQMRKRSYWLAGIAGSSSVILATIWFFINIDRAPLAAELARKIQEITGQHAGTGRDLLWPYILEAARDSPIFGLGAGILPRDILSTHLSSHNYYLQVYLQVGIIGLAVLVAFLMSVWCILGKAITAAGRFGSAVFLMFVVHNGTEAVMFQNVTLIGVPAWCAIGMALAIERNPEFVHRPKKHRAAKTNRVIRGGGVDPGSPRQQGEELWTRRSSPISS